MWNTIAPTTASSAATVSLTTPKKQKQKQKTEFPLSILQSAMYVDLKRLQMIYTPGWLMIDLSFLFAGLPQHTDIVHSNDDMEIKPINPIDSLETRSQSSMSEDLPVDASSTPTPPVRNSTINIPDGGPLSSLGGNSSKTLLLFKFSFFFKSIRNFE